MKLRVEYDPLSAEQRDDPYPAYRELLADQPLHWNETLHAHVVVRHADCMHVLKEPGWSVNRKQSARSQAAQTSNGLGDEVQRSVLGFFLWLDPPDHTRLRNLVSKTFTPRMIARLQPRVEALADDLLTAIARDRRVDFIEAFAYPLPVTVIAEMLGVPPEDRERFRGWSSVLAAGLDPIAPGRRRNTLAAGRALYEYFGEVIAMRRGEPRDDLISDLVAVEEAGDRLTEQELRMLCIMLLIAGHETTVGLLGNGLLALLRNPAELERVRAEPQVVDRAVEELLRYDSPVQMTNRIATSEHVVAGQVITPGQEVITLIGASNHDPSVFATPERLDVGRDPNPHLSFSRGLHFCLGAPLGRLEGRVALPMLLERFPDLRLDGRPEWRPMLTFRGMSRLPVAT